MDINHYLTTQHEGCSVPFPIADRIVCADGFALSVQAHCCAWCTPQNNHGPWTHVEVAFLSDMPDELRAYAEDDEDADEETGGFMGCAFVPIKVVEDLIEYHGGISKEKANEN